MKAISEVGFSRVVRFVGLTFAYQIYRLLFLPPLRVWYLRILGARIGKNCVLHRVHFFNYDRTGFKGLRLGDDVFIGDETLIDLAEGVILDSQVTLAERVTLLTHLSVGYADHPLQGRFPKEAAPIRIESGAFIGAGATILHGCHIGKRVFIGAQALVRESIPADSLAVGIPARVVRDYRAVTMLASHRLPKPDAPSDSLSF